MDLGRENGLQGVPCLCTRRRIQWKCLLRSFSPAQVNLDCQTTHNIWRLLIARVTLRIRQPQVVLYFYSIVQYIFTKNCMLEVKSSCDHEGRKPLLNSAWPSMHSVSLTLLKGTKTSRDWPSSTPTDSLISGSARSRQSWTNAGIQRESIIVYDCYKKVH